MTDKFDKIALKDIFEEAARLIDLAMEKKRTIVTAESCTGGLIGAVITAIPGSSSVFKGGIIAYDNTVKSNQLGVPVHTIERCGAVSAEVAEAMAKGALSALSADIAVSVTGIAGPGGGSEDKPVGTVWVGLATKDSIANSQRLDLGDIGRNNVRDAACYAALKSLAATLDDQ